VLGEVEYVGTTGSEDNGSVRRLTPEALDEAAWEPFGWLPVADTDPRDGEQRLAYVWDDAHVNIIGHARSEVPATADGLRCEMLYRHDTHTQVLMVIDHPAVVAVAPAAVEFTSAADLDQVRVFRLEPLSSLVLHRGTWHWGPFPISAEWVKLFNVQGLRYAEDNAMVDLAAKGMAVEVVLG
jgi:ureidoglycolate hydrolase